MLEVRRDVWGELGDMQRQMEHLLDHFVSGKRLPVMFSSGVWQPLVDVYETEDEVVVVAELAGVKDDDVRIVLHNNRLTISGQRRDARAGASRVYQVMEVSFGRFERAIELPAQVDPQSSTANMCDGFLVVRTKKDRRAVTLTRVTIETGKGAGERKEV